MSGAPVLAFADVSLVLGGARVLDSVDLAVGEGERVGVVAESGVGKSQLLRLALGLSTPLGGKVALFGESPQGGGERVRRLRRRCGVAFQSSSLISGLSVEDNLWLPLGISVAARGRLRRRFNRLTLDFDISHICPSPVDLLSAGERRRVALARCFFAEPELVLLDEPLAGLAGSAAAIEAALRRQVNGRNRAMLLLTQDAALAARWCERTYAIERGRLVETPQQPDTGGALSTA